MSYRSFFMATIRQNYRSNRSLFKVTTQPQTITATGQTGPSSRLQHSHQPSQLQVKQVLLQGYNTATNHHNIRSNRFLFKVTTQPPTITATGQTGPYSRLQHSHKPSQHQVKPVHIQGYNTATHHIVTRQTGPYSRTQHSHKPSQLQFKHILIQGHNTATNHHNYRSNRSLFKATTQPQTFTTTGQIIPYTRPQHSYKPSFKVPSKTVNVSYLLMISIFIVKSTTAGWFMTNIF